MGGVVGLALLGLASYFFYTKFIRKRREPETDENAELDNDGERKPELDTKDAVPEIAGQQHYGQEIDSKRHPGHELPGERRLGHELDGGPHGAELPVREAPAAELP